MAHHEHSGSMERNWSGLDLLFEDLIKDLHSAENQILQALPMMEQAAANSDLKMAFRDHLSMTRSQLQRLEETARTLGIDPTGKVCKGMQGLIAEGQELLKMQHLSADTLDAGLIVAAQKVEHYEIAGYGTLASYARTLGKADAEKVFSQIADEEGKTDQLLTRLAESHINVEATR